MRPSPFNKTSGASKSRLAAPTSEPVQLTNVEESEVSYISHPSSDPRRSCAYKLFVDLNLFSNHLSSMRICVFVASAPVVKHGGRYDAVVVSAG